MQISGYPALAGHSKMPGAGHTPGGADFSGLLQADEPKADSPDPAKAEADDIARMEKDLADYRAGRDKVVQGRTMDPPAFQMALPVNDRGYMPYVTADQQKQIDRITDGYLGRPAEEMERMWAELRANGLAPEQLARTAKYFINLEGEIVSRAVATEGQRSTTTASTAWSVSEM